MMNKKIMVTFIFVAIMVSSVVDAYDNVDTHPRITKTSAPASKLDVFLKQNLGMVNGFKSAVRGKQIIDWLQEGSYAEDTPPCRAVNHFHNPLLPWDQSFMSDDISGDAYLVRQWCEGWGWRYQDRRSAITWATAYLAPPPSGEKVNFSRDMSTSPFTWDLARHYYHQALTLKTKEYRDQYFAATFKTVGHVLHLLQDMGVPAHTRNDFQSHLFRTSDKSYKYLA